MSTTPAENIKVVLKPVKTAFTGQIMLLTPDDAVEYEKLSKSSSNTTNRSTTRKNC
jgi:hypothetical protein